MYSQRLLEHFQHPRNVGKLDPPAVTVEVENPVCGDLMRLSVLFQEGKAAAVRYQTKGCTASVACGSALTELIVGRETREIAGIDAAAVVEAVGGLIPESRHAARLCVDAVTALLRAVNG